jgi:DNA sulfur modification protein DndD
VSQQDYNSYLVDRLHHRKGHPIADEARVALTYLYVQSGQTIHIEIERRWKRKGRTLLETVGVRRNGEPPDVTPADYQAWLQELVPPGLTPLCFFDAERLDEFANPELHNGQLGETLRRLLGLDLVERLRIDLEYLTQRRGGQKADRLRQEVLQQQTDLDALKEQLARLLTESEVLTAEQQELELLLVQQERRLVAEGGNYAARRPQVQEALALNAEESAELAEQLRALCGELLPFALAPELCTALTNRLAREAESERLQIAAGLWQERLEAAQRQLQDGEVWKEVLISGADRELLTQRLMSVFREPQPQYQAQQQPLVHQIAAPDRSQLYSWVTETVNVTAPQARSLGERLAQLREERRSLEEELARAPAEEILAPIHAEILRLQSSLEELQTRRTALDKRLGALQFQSDEQARRHQRAVEQFQAAQASERQLFLAERSKRVLDAYRDALLRQQTSALGDAVVAAFNRLCRKEHLLASTQISAEDFDVELLGASGQKLSLGDFSAGERQIYALALLWALRQVSGRQLPLVIDTPLARLDEIHRWRLFHSYFPIVSNQVILFATEAELSLDLVDRAAPYLARVYHLEFDRREGRTVTTLDAQHTSRGVILYRGVRAEVSGRGVEGDLGQTWTANPEHAGSQGVVRRALLPQTARRLVLVDPFDHEMSHNWPGIAQLEQVTGNSQLASQLRAGRQLHELWREEWAAMLVSAGYDSVATLGIDGPEELVVNPDALVSLDGARNDGGDQP